MRQVFGAAVSAPSSSLLRYLRSQSQDLWFFSPATKPLLCHHSSQSRKQLGNCRPSIAKRKFKTSCRRSATVESAVPGLDLQGQGVRQDGRNSPGWGYLSRYSGSPPHTRLNGASSSRSASTDSRPLLQRLWGSKRRKEDSALKPDDLLPLPSFLDDAGGAVLGRSKVGKAPNEMKLRCTEFDENGKVTHANEEFRKTELIAKVCSLGPGYSMAKKTDMKPLYFSMASSPVT